MAQQRSKFRYLFPVVAGLVMAFISSHYLFHGGPANVLPWGLLAITWGFVATNNAEAWRLGAIYGFALSFCFLWLDKFGHINLKQFLELAIIIPLPSAFGGICGMFISRLTFAIRNWKPRSKNTSV